MPINSLQIQEYMNVFSGSQHNFGEAIYESKDDSGKVSAKCQTITNKLITIKEYKDHLEGEKGLGIIPIKENNKCSFAIIDIDIYNANLDIYVEAIEKNNFPLVPFKSKSGGLHIYLFLKEEESAKKVVEIMRKMSFLLSIDFLIKRRKNSNVEIFPKQIKIRKGEFGSWINLPYFDYKSTQQYAIKENKNLTLSEALMYIKEKQISFKDLNEFLEELPYTDAPPCLQLLYYLNPLYKQTGRNNFLFSFGVYLKKKNEEFFEQNLLELNQEIREPLPDKEVQGTIIKSLKKKDYVYKCKENPCSSFCSKKECKKREYGIGKDEGYFSSIEVGVLYQYKTSQPYYEWEVRIQGQNVFKRLRFKSEDEIIKQDTFMKLCMRELYELPSKLKQGEWFNKVNQALKEIVCIDVSEEEDTSSYIMLKNLIVEFLTQRAMAENRNQLLIGRVYFDSTDKSYKFRVKDLVDFLFRQKQFKYFAPGEIHGILRELNCDYKKIRLEDNKQLRVACFYQSDIKNYYEDKNILQPDFSKYTEEDF